MSSNEMPELWIRAHKPAPQQPAAGQPADSLMLGASVALEAAAEDPAGKDGKPKARKFSMVAYTGGAMSVGAFYHPIVVDLSGLETGNSARPILIDHVPDLDYVLGQTTRMEVKGGKLLVEGQVFGESERARQVIALNDKGFKFQASIGARVMNREFVPEGSTAVVNGQTFNGPINVARKAVLGEVSFVILGADDRTSASIAASSAAKEKAMSFQEWLAAMGLSIDGLTDEQKAKLQAKYNAEQLAAKAGKDADGKNAPVAPEKQAPQIQAGAKPGQDQQGQQDDPVADIRARSAAEVQRIADIRKACGGRHADIEAKAIAEGWDATKTELEVLRKDRPQAGPAIHARDGALSGEILEAACAVSGGLKDVEKRFKPETLEAATRRFRRGIGLQELLLEAAWANGYAGRSFRQDPRGVLHAAFVTAGGFSTYDISGILSNTANKFLLAGFMAVEDTWRQIAATRPVNDFKTVTSYRLTGGFEYEEVGPGGELPHGTMGEESFTNRAKTYGKMLGITRQDIINDDLGALTQVPQRLGRGAALKLNTVFWTAFMDNATFFSSGNANYFDGAATVLSIDSLTTAEQMFFDQTDSDGKPLGVSPEILLVPNALNAKASQLMSSTELRDTTASTKYAVNNPHAGKFRVARSSYLSNSSFSGYSSTAWYLLANPESLAAIEVAFLNGRQEPTVESADADFNTLGIQMRGYHDFGVSKQEHRAGVKSKGAA